MSVDSKSASEETRLLNPGSAAQSQAISVSGLPLQQLAAHPEYYSASSSANFEENASDVEYLKGIDNVVRLLDKGEKAARDDTSTAVSETYCGNDNVNSSRSKAACRGRYFAMFLLLTGVLALIIYSQTDSQTALYIGSGGLSMGMLYGLFDCVASSRGLDEDGNLQEGNLCNGAHSISGTSMLASNWGCFHTTEVRDALHYLTENEQKEIQQFVESHLLKTERDSCCGCRNDTSYLEATLVSFTDKLKRMAEGLMIGLGRKNAAFLGRLRFQTELLRGIQDAELKHYSDTTTTVVVDEGVSPRDLPPGTLISPRGIIRSDSGSNSAATTPLTSPRAVQA